MITEESAHLRASLRAEYHHAATLAKAHQTPPRGRKTRPYKPRRFIPAPVMVASVLATLADPGPPAPAPSPAPSP